ncbi:MULTISPECIES: Hdr-like menaquinol oxidoreductase integral membrane subunit HmeB [Archaeoglobus]|jgi:molybdopterin-containing oxidoreductase family membrane subunit|uniref:Hdr-like menaquinol oxidoreductase integral membrane subunit n=3 Tax=Archaeoglobus fulgidus TaxID=2234 RepID=HMEB_ARCFU|nr:MULTISPECIES: Hdr-like menaquinol oxidoreductase integral membrane subunit HmeB [Archaeoglobus]O29750.1 RecName: Full=Hdr-like menaquinol oxidoreductase integral membrane subunit; Short=Hme subunit B [Archaeoglobus fulgidus DSM 4304]AAB90737.1 molybdopterin oxidoreductase, membrane subunit [Archaeoglobus fulgidus DSM 4304]AIG97318.1 Polysulfide reductase [Archaeoglobus fulgidus DSM 8774]KUJ92610.1 MAG: Hdr-like menaquinol oxidoreductase integral membrane subunit [Archaeoglobus fulgidus]KUK0
MAVEFKKIEGDSIQYFALVIILAAVTALGFYAYVLDHKMGLNGLSNRVPWGIVNAGIPYFIGLSAGSLIVSALAGVFNIKKYKVFSRIAAYMAAAWIIAAILSIALDIGKLYHFMNAVRYFNPTSIFSWNAFLYSSYFVICSIYLLVQFEEMEKATRFMAGLAVFWAVLVHSGTGAIYSFVYSKELYHSALTPPMFIVCAITSGLGLLLANLYFTFRFTKRELDPKLIRGLALIFAGLMMVLGYFLAVEGLEKGYIPALHEAVQFVFLTPTSGVFWSFWLLVIFGIAIPIIIVLNPKTGYDLRWITFAGILHAALVFAERFYLIIPGQVFPEEYLPGYELESLHTLEGYIVSYTPSVFEWLQVIGLIAMVYLIFVVGVKLFALIPERAVEEVVEE